MDDMLVKSKSGGTYIDDLEEAFFTLRKYKMKLNPIKCAYGMTFRKFLSFMISGQEIEVNLEKIKAIQEVTPPRTIKVVQCLMEKVAALNQFVSRSVE